MKKSAVLMLAIIILVTSLCGCSIDNGLLKAPRPSGELGDIRTALENTVTVPYALKYATDGDYRSSFITRDINGDGSDEAVVFYSTEQDGKKALHFALIKKNGTKWKTTANTELGGTEVVRVDFGDMNGDGNDEMFVAWSIYGAPDRRLTVYDMTATIPSQIFEGSYSDFCVNDITNDRADELLIFNLDAAAKIASCCMYKMEDDLTLKQASYLTIGNGVTAIKKITKSRIGKKSAVFLDILRENSLMFTEVLISGNGKLNTALSDNSVVSYTYRKTDLTSADIDGDGKLEIPCTMGRSAEQDTRKKAILNVTDWKSFNGTKLVSKELSIVSSEHKYRFVISDGWLGKFVCVPNANNGMIFYGTGITQKELFRIEEIPNSEFAKLDEEKIICLYQNAGKSYIAKVKSLKADFKLSEKIIISGFKVGGV